MAIRRLLSAAFIAANMSIALPALATANEQRPNHDIGNIVDTALNAFMTTQAIMETAAKDPHVVAYYDAHAEHINRTCTPANNKVIIRGYYPDFFTPFESRVEAPRQKYTLENLGQRLEQAKNCLEVSIAAYSAGREEIRSDYADRLSAAQDRSHVPRVDERSNNFFADYFVDQKIERFKASKAEVEKMLSFYKQFGVDIGRKPSDPSPWPQP